MTYPPPGGSPDPYQPQQPYGQQPSYPQDPYTTPSSGAPSSGQPYGAPSSGQPYPPPAYGQQSYGQEQYGQQSYPPPYGGPVVATTNTLAILALVFAFVFSPAAIVLGHMAKKQIRQTGEQGEGLATAGLWLGYIFTGLSVALCALYAILIAVGVSSSGDF
ncbi:DUF4190 domain-containing protein [Actinoplanes sp. NPDC049265]|uniref:DUF4190 domain-containing protein n=1 Tax=Actinoplanes sp. NPDC049265 TaxID=3363902 RepID=UPI00371868FB